MVDFLSGMFGGGFEKEAANKDILAANQYSNAALPALAAAYQTGQTNLGQAVGAYDPLKQLGAQYSQAAPTYLGALGIGTPQQVSAAGSAFSTDPGYQFALQQAQQAIQRNFAPNMSISGNLAEALQKNAVGYANQDYQNWIKNLQQAGGMGLNATQQAAQGAAGGYTNLANLAQEYGQNQANVYGNVEGATIGANNLAAQGQAAGAKNLLGAGLQLATLGMMPLSPGGGFGSSLFGNMAQGGSNLLSGGGGGGGGGAVNVGGYALPTVGYNPMVG